MLPKVAVEDQVGLAIKLISMVHEVTSTIDRYYVLLVANWIMNRVSLLLLSTKQGASTLFLLFSEQWFITLWNDQDDGETISSLKDEFCLALLEASLLVRREKKSCELSDIDAWLLSSVEVAEFSAKVMDWKLKSGHALAEQVS
jgi:hypothetical protein